MLHKSLYARKIIIKKTRNNTLPHKKLNQQNLYVLKNNHKEIINKSEMINLRKNPSQSISN